MPGSYPHVGKYPSQNERFGIYGLPERKEQSDDIPTIWKYEVDVQKQLILVYDMLYRYGKKKKKRNPTVHCQPVRTGQER